MKMPVAELVKSLRDVTRFLVLNPTFTVIKEDGAPCPLHLKFKKIKNKIK